MALPPTSKQLARARLHIIINRLSLDALANKTFFFFFVGRVRVCCVLYIETTSAGESAKYAAPIESIASFTPGCALCLGRGLRLAAQRHSASRRRQRAVVVRDG